MKSLRLASLFWLLLTASSCLGTGDFPIVDLGYARHAPTTVNTTSSYNISFATYSNIRFAQPPVGDLRFRAPKLPPPNATGIQTGVVELNATNCPQAIPSYFTVDGINGTSWGNEDCLFLDVIVPEGITSDDRLPVLHWIYGGGFFYGAKDTGGKPTGLYEYMQPDEKFIVVASNYRLGALGWMSKEEPTMVANAGLYDSLAALDWTKKYIHLFGGNEEQITVMGQSAGAGIIEHLLAANVQGRSMPFRQAILSSSGYRPHINRSIETTMLYEQFLNATNCTSITCARELSPAEAAEGNRILFQDYPSAGFPGPSISFGPLIDGDLVTDVPWRVLEERHGEGQVERVIIGTMQNDGAGSTVGDFYSWREQLKVFARTPSDQTVQVATDLYGSFNGSRSSFNTNGVDITPFDSFSQDVIYHCKAYAAATSYQSNTTWGGSYRYSFSIPPALHGTDLEYYFYDAVVAAVDPSVVSEVAKELQTFIRKFIRFQDMEGWPEYGNAFNPAWLNITKDGLEPTNGGEELDLVKRCPILLDLLKNKADGW